MLGGSVLVSNGKLDAECSTVLTSEAGWKLAPVSEACEKHHWGPRPCNYVVFILTLCEWHLPRRGKNKLHWRGEKLKTASGVA